MGLQRVRHDWVTEPKWTELNIIYSFYYLLALYCPRLTFLFHIRYSNGQSVQFSSVQALSHVRLFVIPWIAALQASLFITNSRSSPRLGPSSPWCHPAISSSVVPFSSCLQSCRASQSFPVSHFFTSGGQSIGVSASASILPVNIQDWFPLGLTGLISFQSKGLSRVFSNTTVQKHQFFSAQLSL